MIRPTERSLERKREHIDAMVELRPLVFERDNYHCARCGNDYLVAALEAHHRLPRGNGGPDTMENLVSLCGPNPLGCHGHIHAHPDEGYASGLLIRESDGPPVVAWRVFPVLPKLTFEGYPADDGGGPQHSGDDHDDEEHGDVLADW